MNDATINISIIIPMFNCEAVIARCLDSIDYMAAEIIVVDDGSMDDSATIVSEYIKQAVKQKRNIRLIQKHNGGVSSARNVGIDNAHGKYIMFIDADDYIAADGIERVLRIAMDEDVDVLKYEYLCVNANSPIDISSLKNIPYTMRWYMGKAEALRHYDLSDYVIWDALFKRSLLEENHIRFNEQLYLHEDDVFMGTVLGYAKNVIEVDLRLYRYVVASNQSATHRKTPENIKRLIDSSVLAIRARQSALTIACPNDEFPLEKYKHMRYAHGCIWTMLNNDFSDESIAEYLAKFRELGVYPLQYKWIKVGRMDWSKKNMFKFALKTWICNHPKYYKLIKNIGL